MRKDCGMTWWNAEALDLTRPFFLLYIHQTVISHRDMKCQNPNNCTITTTSSLRHLFHSIQTIPMNSRMTKEWVYIEKLDFSKVFDPCWHDGYLHLSPESFCWHLADMDSEELNDPSSAVLLRRHSFSLCQWAVCKINIIILKEGKKWDEREGRNVCRQEGSKEGEMICL